MNKPGEGFTMNDHRQANGRITVRSRYKRHDRTEKESPEEPTPSN